jgi:hypothetical protein
MFELVGEFLCGKVFLPPCSPNFFRIFSDGDSSIELSDPLRLTENGDLRESICEKLLHMVYGKMRLE